MRRWHAERDLMLRRWRQEIAKHEVDDYPTGALAPLPPASDGSCHCYRGPGFLRKRRPWDCGNPRCGVCHMGKWDKKARASAVRAAIESDLSAA